MLTGTYKLEEKKSVIALGVVCWLVYFSTYLGRYNFSASMSEMAGMGTWGKAQLGGVAAAFYLSYGLGQFPGGILGDRISQRLLVLAGLLGAAVTNCLFPFAGSIGAMQAVWFLNGIAQALIWPPMARLIADYTSARQCVNIVLWLSSTGPAGMLCSYLFSALLIEARGWKYCFFAAGVWLLGITVFWGVSISLLQLRIRKCEILTEKKKEDIKQEKIKSFAFLTPVFAGFMAATFIHGLLKDGLTTWIPTFLTEVFRITPSFSVMLTTILPVINLVGVYLANVGNRRLFNNEAKTAACFFLFTLISVLCMVTVFKNSLFGTVLLFAVITSTMTGVNTLFISLLPMHFQKEGAVATVSGILNAVTYVGSAASSVLFGLMTERCGWAGTRYLWSILAAAGTLLCGASMIKWKRVRQDIYKD